LCQIEYHPPPQSVVQSGDDLAVRSPWSITRSSRPCCSQRPTVLVAEFVAVIQAMRSDLTS
jgi:hypothetical protein